MKYVLSFTFFWLLVTAGISAQSPLQFGLRAGLNIGNVDEVVTAQNSFSVDDLTGLPTTTTARPQLGLWLAIPVNEKLAVQPELLWSRKILKFQSSEPEPGFTRFDYLSVPLLLVGKPHEHWRIELGPEVGWLLRHSLEDGIDTTPEKSPFISDNQIELGTNLGVRYQQDGWMLGARYFRGLTSVQTIDFLEISGVPAGVIKQYHQGVTLWLGYTL